VLAHDLASDVEPEPRAPLQLARTADARELLEQLSDLIRGNAGTRVADSQLDPAVSQPITAHGDLSALFAVLGGVPEQILEDDLQERGVSLYRHIGGKFNGDVHGLLFEASSEIAHHRGDDVVAHNDRPRTDLELALLDAGEIEVVEDHLLSAHDGGMDVIEGLDLVLCHVAHKAPLQGQHVDLHGGDLVLQLMGNELESVKVALVPATQFLAGLLQLLQVRAQGLVPLTEGVHHLVERPPQTVNLVLPGFGRFREEAGYVGVQLALRNRVGGQAQLRDGLGDAAGGEHGRDSDADHDEDGHAQEHPGRLDAHVVIPSLLDTDIEHADAVPVLVHHGFVGADVPGANDVRRANPCSALAHDVVVDFLRNPAPHRSLARRIQNVGGNSHIVLEYGDGPEVMAAVCVHGEDAAAQGIHKRRVPLQDDPNPHRALYLAPRLHDGTHGFEHHALPQFRGAPAPRHGRITDSY